MSTTFIEVTSERDHPGMAIRKEDWPLINKAIADAISMAIAPLKPSGWRRALSTLREWGVLAVIAALIVALLGLAAAAFYQATGRIEKETKFQTNTEDRLKDIEGDVRDIRAQLTKQSLATHAALPLADFKATLPDLGSSIAAAQKQNLKISPNVMDALSNKLSATDTNTPSFWPVAGLVITYRSSLFAPSVITQVPPCRAPGLPSDMENEPNAAVQIMGPDGKPTGPKIHIERLRAQDCFVDLDGKKISRWDCARCVIKYSGGPLSMHDDIFEDCLFIFAVPARKVPPPSGQRFGQLLLSSALTRVEIKDL